MRVRIKKHNRVNTKACFSNILHIDNTLNLSQGVTILTSQPSLECE
jgi:hypothetical protein